MTRRRKCPRLRGALIGRVPTPVGRSVSMPHSPPGDQRLGLLIHVGRTTPSKPNKALTSLQDNVAR
jgi:hypothetical protein